ncbi:MAG: hypothetical protein JXR52_11675 [Bacteroidales bacterium]|nr:hypothetical protein [Bacteroidales bacterium]
MKRTVLFSALITLAVMVGAQEAAALSLALKKVHTPSVSPGEIVWISRHLKK